MPCGTTSILLNLDSLQVIVPVVTVHESKFEFPVLIPDWSLANLRLLTP